MRIGLALPIFEDAPARQPFGETFALCELADRLGFSFGSVGHHHFAPGALSAPWVFLAAVAGRTESIRLGTAVLMLPLESPVAVAEQVATLDQVSGGRAVLGVAMGYRKHEYDVLGVPFRRRGALLEQGIEALHWAWSQDASQAPPEGAHLASTPTQVTPSPVQSPHPPIWVGGFARRAIDRAGRLGDGWIGDAMQTLTVHQQRAALYRDASAAAGRQPTVCIMRSAAIGTRSQLEETWLPLAAQQELDHWRAGARGKDDGDLGARLERGERLAVSDLARNRSIVGDAAKCIAELGRYRDAINPDEVQLWFDTARDPLEFRRTIEAFGNEVLPAFA